VKIVKVVRHIENRRRRRVRAEWENACAPTLLLTDDGAGIE